MTNKKKQQFKFNSAPTQRWDDLEVIDVTIRKALSEMVLQIQEHLLVLLTSEYFRNDPEVKLFQDCFLEDFNDFVDRLKVIKDKYNDKKGLVAEDDMGLYLTLGGEYEILSGLVTDILFKHAIEIQDKFMQLIALKEKEKQTEKEEVTNE